jgi:hypothetical protein
MNIAISCVASEDYLKKYRKCIDSQKKYCIKHGYEYIINSNSVDIVDWRDWYWKKLWVIPEILKKYDIAILIDADCEIKDNTPTIESIIDNNSIYYVLGASKRPNSGFLIFKNTDRSKNFLKDVLSKRGKQLPPGCEVKGENGYVIWSLNEDATDTKELPILWNCSDPSLIDTAYIIHYTNKMRSFFDNE